jgi:hypothetical protein
MELINRIKKLTTKGSCNSISKDAIEQTPQDVLIWGNVIYDSKKKTSINIELEMDETFAAFMKYKDQMSKESRTKVLRININEPLTYNDIKKLYNTKRIIVSKEEEVMVKPFDNMNIHINYSKEDDKNCTEYLTYTVKTVTWSEYQSQDRIIKTVSLQIGAHMDPESRKQMNRKLKVRNELNNLFQQPEETKTVNQNT